MDQIEEILTRRVEKILPTKEGLAKLMSQKKIRLYQGFDPSSPNLHVGHLVGLLQLKSFQDLGHEVIFLIGDFTAMIGDPTDKSATRQKLSKEQVQKNAKTYKEQAGKILRFKGDNPAQMKFNSEWLEKLKFNEVLELSSNFTIQQLIERNMFQERLKQNKPIFLHEFIYPLMVTYDALAMEVDLEVGGNDQLFNMAIGRNILKERINKDKFVLTTKLLTDSQGRKIGKTTGNAINLFGDPNDLFGQIMALPDDTIIPAFKLTTTVPLDEISQFESKLDNDPMSLKKRLAFEVVKLCHGEDRTNQAQSHFQTTIQQGQTPDKVEEFSIKLGKHTLLEICQSAKVGKSNANIKRTITQGGVEFNGKKITDPNQEIDIKGGEVLKFGKRIFKKVKK